MRWHASFGAISAQAARLPKRVEPGVWPAHQLLLCSGSLPQAYDPPSLRFLGRKVYLATVVTLVSAMLLGTTPARLARLSAVPGIDRRTMTRWRAWWRSTFAAGWFRPIAAAAFMPPLDIAGLPVSLLDRCAGDIEQKLTAVLRFLEPLTGGTSAMRGL